MDELKMQAAKAALAYLDDHTVVGVGTGSTANYFIKSLATIKHRLDACIASSKMTEQLLKEQGIPVIDLNAINYLPIYIDGADEVTAAREMVKGGGGAMTREKILATAAQQFICIVDHTKVVGALGNFPIAVEVLPLARSFVARELVKLGGNPCYREGKVTDNGNCILDTFWDNTAYSLELEQAINLITGVVENGLFCKRVADVVLVGMPGKVRIIT